MWLARGSAARGAHEGSYKRESLGGGHAWHCSGTSGVGARTGSSGLLSRTRARDARMGAGVCAQHVESQCVRVHSKAVLKCPVCAENARVGREWIEPRAERMAKRQQRDERSTSGSCENSRRLQVRTGEVRVVRAPPLTCPPTQPAAARRPRSFVHMSPNMVSVRSFHVAYGRLTHQRCRAAPGRQTEAAQRGRSGLVRRRAAGEREDAGRVV